MRSLDLDLDLSFGLSRQSTKLEAPDSITRRGEGVGEYGGEYGGGTEMLLNCDIVVASDDAVIALPEVKRGVYAAMGGEHLSHCGVQV